MSDKGDNRVIVLVDMDCFYCQVEVRLAPKHKGKPLAVVQYNAWRGGGIIAVNYEARDKGVKRGMRGDEAKKLCPDIILCKVAEVRGKADLTKYRDAGREVVDVLQEFSSQIQVASIDESYLDVTEAVEKRMAEISVEDIAIPLEKLPSTFVIGHTDEKSNDESERISGLETWLQQLSDPSCLRLAIGAVIAEEMRAAVFDRTSFRCSAGISYNKPLAKLVCGVHKPNRQTILPPDKVSLFFSTLPLRKMRNLGGKFGMEVAERLGCGTMGDLAKFSLKELQRHYDDKNGLWLYNIAHGIDHEPVTVRLIPKSIGCSKNFPGRTALATKKEVEYWMNQLISELVVRLTEDQTNNKRRAQHFTVSVSQDSDDGSLGSVTRSGSLPCYNVDRLVALAMQLITKTNAATGSSLSWDPPIKNISLSAGKFTADCSSQKSSIQSFFKHVSKDIVDCRTLEMNNDGSQQLAHESLEINSSESIPKEKSKRSSVDSYSEPNNVMSDHDCSRDLFLDETSIGSENNEVSVELFSKGNTLQNFSGIISGQSKFESSSKNGSSQDVSISSSQSRKRKADFSDSRCEQEACPESLESAVSKSFFARFILSKKMEGKTVNGSLIGPSTSKDNTNESSLLMSHVETETEADNNISSESDGNIFEKCEECGKLIALQEFPEHVDYHSALRLQKELNETLTPPDQNVAGPSTAGGSKQHTSHHSNDSSTRDSEAASLHDEISSETLKERCSYCSKLIPLEEFPEHIDYHSALKLQKELNKPTAPQVIPSNPASKKKKGTSTKLGPSPSKKGKANPITSFFKPQ